MHHMLYVHMYIYIYALHVTCIVEWSKKLTILTNLLFHEIRHHLNIKIGFQAVEIYFLTFSSCFFTSYLQPIRNKLLKTLSIFYSTKWGKYRPYVGYNRRAKLFTKNFSKNSNLDDSGISFPVFLSRTTLHKLQDG